MVAVSTNGSDPQNAFTPVIAALNTMRDGQRGQKEAAHSFLESFQKSVGCVFQQLCARLVVIVVTGLLYS